MSSLHKEPSEESIRAAMDQAWRDHHHARDQTWKTVQIEAVLGAGLVTVDAEFGHPLATAAAGALVVIATLFGILISMHHRRVERTKITHILNCERALGLLADHLIPETSGVGQTGETGNAAARDIAVGAPAPLKILDVINPKCRNTAIFILRMHIAIMLFAFLVVITRLSIT